MWGDPLKQCQVHLNGLRSAVACALIGLAGQRRWGLGNTEQPTSESSVMNVPSTLPAHRLPSVFFLQFLSCLVQSVPTSHKWLLKFKFR